MDQQIQEISQQSMNSQMEGMQEKEAQMKNKILELEKENCKLMLRIVNESNKMIMEIQEHLREKRQMHNTILQLEKEKKNKSGLVAEQLHEDRNFTDKEAQVLKNENSEMNKKILQLQEQNTKTSNDLMQEIKRAEKLQEQSTAMAIEIQQLQLEKNDMNGEIQQLRQDKSRLHCEILQLHQENTDKNNAIQELQQEIDRLRQQNSTISSGRGAQNRRIEHDTISSFITECDSIIVSDQELGRGAYATVYKGDFYGTTVAVKEIHKVIISDRNLKMLRREIEIASQCRHPNLLQFLCTTKTHQSNLSIVTELMDMALRTLLEQREKQKMPLEGQQVKAISLDVARGLNYLHSKKPNPIIHRDVSSANVLLLMNDSGSVRRAKVSDYGSVNLMQACRTRNPGAPPYAAPEAGFMKYDPKVMKFVILTIGLIPSTEIDSVKDKCRAARAVLYKFALQRGQ